MTEDKSGTLAGKRLGAYQLAEKLGQGGMGAVYRARDISLQRTVAVKVLPAALAADRTCVQRFVREARTLARLSHPNLVHIYHVGQKDGLYYFAMEHIDGRTLNRVLRESGPLPVAEFLRCCGQVLAALHRIHGAGLTHRDIKSGNVMIENGTGRAVLMDFGLAKDRDAPGAETGAGLTSAGVVLGTPEYMSPEQAEGREADARSDLYSFGVMAYEMLTGSVPFTGRSAIAVLRQQVEAQPPPLAERRPGLPAGLDAFIARAMCKEAAGRYASAAEMAVDLVRIGHTSELAELAAAGLTPTAQTIVNMGAPTVPATGPFIMPTLRPPPADGSGAAPGAAEKNRTALLLGLAGGGGFALVMLLVLVGTRGCRRRRERIANQDGSGVAVPAPATRPGMECRLVAGDGRSVRVRVLEIEGSLATVQEFDAAGHAIGGPVEVNLRDFQRIELIPPVPAPPSGPGGAGKPDGERP